MKYLKIVSVLHSNIIIDIFTDTGCTEIRYVWPLLMVATNDKSFSLPKTNYDESFLCNWKHTFINHEICFDNLTIRI